MLYKSISNLFSSTASVNNSHFGAQSGAGLMQSSNGVAGEGKIANVTAPKITALNGAVDISDLHATVG